MHVLSIGECMAELAPAAAPGEFRLGFAGDTFNTAWYLARMHPDIEVSYLTAVGDDAISGQMHDFIAQGGIGVSHVRRVANQTVGLYLISLDRGERSFSYWRGQSAARQLARDPDAVRAAMAQADVVYFSGITLAILDPASRQTLLDALKDARAAGKTIAFDPNLRPRLWSDTSEMTRTIMQGAGVSDIALPSFEDEAQWFADQDPEATAERYVSAGATTVVVKNGPEPVHFRQAGTGGTVAVRALPRIVDTTAAGDSFNAEILAGLSSGAALETSIASACALSGLVVQSKGALIAVDPAGLHP
ncbi:sugar kinase [Roseivivax sp. CAU 1753]